MENKFVRAESPDDPDRCQAVVANGQCPYKHVPNSLYCPMHGGNRAVQKQEKDNIRNYQIAKYQARLDQFAENPKVKSLREEIALLRMILETTVNKCNDPDDILMFSNKISDLVMKVEKVVTACHRLEQSTGQLLDRSMALNFASQILDIIAKHVQGDVLDQISNEIIRSLADIQTVPKDE